MKTAHLRKTQTTAKKIIAADLHVRSHKKLKLSQFTEPCTSTSFVAISQQQPSACSVSNDKDSDSDSSESDDVSDTPRDDVSDTPRDDECCICFREDPPRSLCKTRNIEWIQCASCTIWAHQVCVPARVDWVCKKC
jgi:hypothetical protein